MSDRRYKFLQSLGVIRNLSCFYLFKISLSLSLSLSLLFLLAVPQLFVRICCLIDVTCCCNLWSSFAILVAFLYLKSLSLSLSLSTLAASVILAVCWHFMSDRCYMLLQSFVVIPNLSCFSLFKISLSLSHYFF